MTKTDEPQFDSVTVIENDDETSCVYVDGDIAGWVRENPGCENERCIAAIEAGLTFHATPRVGTLETYHYASHDRGVLAVVEAWKSQETPAEELGRLQRTLSELGYDTPEYASTLDRIAVLVREQAVARRKAL